MFASDITLQTKVYSTTKVGGFSTTRNVAGLPSNTAKSLFISHQESKKLMSSVVMLTDSAVLSITDNVPLIDDIKVMMKFSYAPMSGRTTTEADVKSMVLALTEFLTPANVVKLLNRES